MDNKAKIQLASLDELLGAPTVKEGTENIDVKKIVPFKDHPFKVLDDEKMEDLVESIKTNGMLTPVIVRPVDNGLYEMISGHRRLHAAKLAELGTIPAIVKSMTDEEAVITMVDANVQREEILPSERAWSLKMKFDAIKKQGSRTDLTSCTECTKSENRATGIVGEAFGLKARQVSKYIRLTELLPELLEMVDSKILSLVIGVDISYFDKTIQKWLYDYLKDNGTLKQIQIDKLKETPDLDNISQYDFIKILKNALPNEKISTKVSLSDKKLNKYFAPTVSGEEREKIILELLEKWKMEQDN